MKTASKIISKSELPSLLERLKSENKKIVFTNGCFDILHLGHIDYLEKTSEEGDFLILGLNSDSSVKRLKGEKRPINKEEIRAKMLAALSFIDAVVLFEEDTPFKLIQSINPDKLIKGGDYLTENIVGADIVQNNGGVVKTIPFLEGFSTTSFIEQIKNS